VACTSKAICFLEVFGDRNEKNEQLSVERSPCFRAWRRELLKHKFSQLCQMALMKSTELSIAAVGNRHKDCARGMTSMETVEITDDQ
jgi:hypothetical protein